MGSRPRSLKAMPMRSKSRRRSNPHRKVFKPLNYSRTRAASSSGSGCSPAVISDKLEALKNLIQPAHIDHAPEIKADQLFQQTADYIVLLRTQISVLQKLIDFYGADAGQENQNAV